MHWIPFSNSSIEYLILDYSVFWQSHYRMSGNITFVCDYIMLSFLYNVCTGEVLVKTLN